MSGSDNSVLNVGPFEVLIDVPIHMGCYESNAKLIETSGQLEEVTPASCIRVCDQTNTIYRFAGRSHIPTELYYIELPPASIENERENFV